jgi:hypothetical protein
LVGVDENNKLHKMIDCVSLTKRLLFAGKFA